MIKSWKHKGLQAFYLSGKKSGIQAKHADRLSVILQLLDRATKPEDMNLWGMSFHKLSGKLKNHFAVKVSGNWRIIFKFENGNAVLVDYLDYH